MKIVVATQAAVSMAKHGMLRRASADWRRHRTLQAFYEANLKEWPEIQQCDRRFILRARDYPRPGVKVISIPCRQDPFCFRCANRKTILRVQRAYDAFHACKPADKAPRFMHIVQTAPVNQDGTGWGVNAADNIEAFFVVVWNALRDTFGDGIGAKMTYQHFGSYGPRKVNPHIDLTLNGWRLEDGKATRIRYLDLKRGDLQKWNRVFADHARVLGSEGHPGNPFFGHVSTSAAGYFPVMAYQLRELWDFASVSHPAPGVLRWHSYKGGWHDYTDGQFFHHMLDYQRRFGQWGDGQAATLHRLFGHMAKGQVDKTMRAMGGKERLHPRNCVCGQCQDWYPVPDVIRAPGDQSRAWV